MNREISIDGIDKGNSFDWGRTSQDYAKFRDIYPEEFYSAILRLGLCKEGQRVLDIGTGTGVLPRNMYRFGAEWTGTDISGNQIEQAKLLAEEKGMDIDFLTCPAEKLSFPADSFDVITACQCIWYPDHKITSKRFAEMLKNGGSFLILIMEWLPFEDEIAGRSEDLILKYNPAWSGCGETVHPIAVPEEYYRFFDLKHSEEFLVDVPFTRESWHGRMRACRGTSASMPPAVFEKWEREHREMLLSEPEKFTVRHFVALAELVKK